MVAEIKDSPKGNGSATAPTVKKGDKSGAKKIAHLKRPSQRRRAPEKRIAIWGPMLVVLALAMMLTVGIWRHIQKRNAQREFATQTGKVTVEVVDVKRDQKPHDLILPGNITAMQETTIYARANGYIAKYLVDIGDEVKAGQLLAELETPELDQQLAGARNSLKQSEANFELARTTAQRWQTLAQKQVVAKQDNDERQGNYQSSAAGVDASKSEVGRLEQLQGFKKVIAPFAGKITARKIDTGSLVSEGSGTTGTALYTLAQTDPLRIFVDVPQSEAPLIQVGMEAKVFVKERANRDFTGKVTRTAGALDPNSRTLRVEVQVPNSDGALFAGMYAQVKFTLTDNASPIIIPSNVFVFRASGTQVATVKVEAGPNGEKPVIPQAAPPAAKAPSSKGKNADKKKEKSADGEDANANDPNQPHFQGKATIHWQPVQAGRDFGTYMEVLTGLEEGTYVVMNPTDDLTEGLEVEPRTPAKAAEKADGQGQTGAEKKVDGK